MHDIRLRNKSNNDIKPVLVGVKNMTKGARILQPLICNTFAGGQELILRYTGPKVADRVLEIMFRT